jgi:hypothetical protein
VGGERERERERERNEEVLESRSRGISYMK